MQQEQKTVLRVYTAFAVMLVLSCIPHLMAAAAAAILFAGILVAAYSIRSGGAPGGFTAAHMTWIIRTIWISSFIGGITTALASIYVLKHYDPSIIHQCVDGIMNGTENVDACISRFIEANYNTFIIGAILAGVPVGLYLVYRFIRGGYPALQGHSVRNPQAWL